MNKIPAKQLADYTEKIWILGTDILDDETNDLELMNAGIKTTMVGDYCAFYYTYSDEYKKLGYSQYFCSIIKEACRRGYSWVIFDRDVTSNRKA